MAISKIVLNETTQTDLTDTTAEASDVAQGKYFYGADGVKTLGTATGGGLSLDDVWNRDLSGEWITNVSGARKITATFDSSKITKVYAPFITDLGNNAFANVKTLESVYCPRSNASSTVFSGCSELKVAVLLAQVWQSAFSGCTKLHTVDLLSTNGSNRGIVRTGSFNNCAALKTLILRSDNSTTSVYPLANVNNFGGTPFASGKTGGTIYIPKFLYDHLGDGTALDYQSATNWSTVHGYGTITWAQIEGSYYETHYADGTEIDND